MNAKAVYLDFLQQLKELYDDNEALAINSWLFESVAGIGRQQMVIDPSKILPGPVCEALQQKLMRLLQHEPIQYVLGEAWFYKMKLKVDAHVLVPRPETEELVEWILTEVKNKNEGNVNALDIGTGSGCIAIAVKKNAVVDMSAIDLSEGALIIAKENAVLQNVPVNFMQADFLNEQQWEQLPKFDLIISNPPYIPVNEKEKMDLHVTAYEPHAALFVPHDDPLLFYKKIVVFSQSHLNTGGKIFVEMHEDYAKETAALFSTAFEYVEVRKDISGKDRMLLAKRNT